jgi:hypothetical protein
MSKTNCCTLALVLAVAGSISMDANAFKVIAKRGHEVRWSQMPVKYYIQQEGPKSFRPGGYDPTGEKISLTEIIKRSFDGWRNTTGIELSYSYEGTMSDADGGDDGKNEIIFVSKNWQELEFSPPVGALAVTISTYDTDAGKIVDADIYFNDEYFDWGNIDSKSEEDAGYIVDIQNIATHEIGHLFGLDHSSENPVEEVPYYAEATMYYSSYAGDVSRREIKEDDRYGIQHLYPSRDIEAGIEKPEIYSISPDIGHNMSAPTTVTVKGKNFTPLTTIRLTADGIRNDEVCKIYSYDSTTAECEFDLYYVSGGTYDLVAANSYKESSILKDAFTVNGKEFEENQSGGGCGRMDSNGKPSNLMAFGMIILVFPIMIGFGKRRAFVLAKVVKK